VLKYRNKKRIKNRVREKLSLLSNCLACESAQNATEDLAPCRLKLPCGDAM